MNDSSCTLYIIRHGETEWNLNSKLQGQLDSPLTQFGIQEIKKTAAKLNAIAFDAVYSSDLHRAKHTAQLLFSSHQLPIITSKKIRERNFGPYNGKTFQEFMAAFKKAYQSRSKLSTEDRMKFKFHQEIESDEEIMSRTLSFLGQVVANHQGKNIVIVTHGGVMRTLLVKLGYCSYHQIPPDSIKNAAYFTLKSNGLDFIIDDVSQIGGLA